MTVALPSGGIASAEPRFIDFGGILSGALGGSDQRLNRLGSRWGCDFTTKPMKGEEARVWIARLIRGMKEKASIKFPQPGVTIPYDRTNVSLTTFANSEVIELGPRTAWALGTPLLTGIKEGWFFSVVVNGNRYLYQATSNSTVHNAGVAGEDPSYQLFSMQPPARTDIPNEAEVEIKNAKIEGYVKGDVSRWTVDNAKIYGLSFSIDEAA